MARFAFALLVALRVADAQDVFIPASQLRGSASASIAVPVQTQNASEPRNMNADSAEELNSVQTENSSLPTSPTHAWVKVLGLGSLRCPVAQDVAYCKGIPYAKPPTGALRWQPPEEHGPWESPRDATDFGAACPQEYPGVPVYVPGSNKTDEDCLFLNVAAPVSALQGHASLPVMLFIHGGDFINGNANPYSADSIVARSDGTVVVVTINYRFRVFGFLASAEVQSNTSDGSAGNFGLQDQRMSMAWVKEHIAAFGGNGEVVTIFGQSQGAVSILGHLAMKRSFPYYTKAILESGTEERGATTMEKAEANYQKLLNLTGCRDLACLRTVDADTLLAKGGPAASNYPHPWRATIDGVELTATPVELIFQGQYSKVPIILGGNREEFMTPIMGFNFSIGSEADFDRAALSKFVDSGNLEHVKKLYNPLVYPYPKDLGGYSIWAWMLARVMNDSVLGMGHCGVRSVARALVAGGSPAVFAYQWEHPPQMDISAIGIPGTGPGNVAASHGTEIPSVFIMRDALNPGEETDLAMDMSGFWIQFGKMGNPNMHGKGTWPLFPAEGDKILRFDVASHGGIREQENRTKMACDFWEAQSTALSNSSIPASADDD